MAADFGFVYFLGNDSMPGIFKIGFTTKHPKIRAAELSAATGCPECFWVAAYFGVESPERIERVIHALLRDFRVSRSREFFRISLLQVEEMIDLYHSEYEDAIYRRRLDNLIALQDYEEAALA